MAGIMGPESIQTDADGTHAMLADSWSAFLE
jgi:hypothetical protein